MPRPGSAKMSDRKRDPQPEIFLGKNALRGPFRRVLPAGLWPGRAGNTKEGQVHSILFKWPKNIGDTPAHDRCSFILSGGPPVAG